MNYHFELDKTKITPSYRKYRVISSDKCAGMVLFELYGSTWNLELMRVVPQGKGIGSALLKYALERENLNPKNMTVCPISEESHNFFKKRGFSALAGRNFY